MAGPPSTSSSGRRTSAGPGTTQPGTFGPGSTLAGQDFQTIADKLKEPSFDLKAKVALATELRDSIDMHQKDLDLARLFEVLLPAFVEILHDGKPSMIGNSPENKLRNLLIQILHRLPHVEPLRQHAPSLMALLLQLLRTENEENAVLCMKVVIDLHRTYSRPPPPSPSNPPNPDGAPDPTVQQIEASVDEFLEIVAELFKNMGSVVEETFRDTRSTRSSAQAGGSGSSEAASQSPAAPPASLEGEGGAAGGTANVVHAPAMRSFKLLQDCPASIVFIFQTYRPMVNKAITIFVPLVFDSRELLLTVHMLRKQFIQMQAAPQAKKHASMEKGQSWVGICPEIPKEKRAAFESMVMAQTKTMSFLAYIHRVSNTALSAYLNVLPEIAVRLMKDCPSEAVAMKRDLIIATRHILQSDLRTAFLSQIDTLLDEHVLTGNSVTGHENLRPLAYSMLADLIHHCRADLTLPQLSRVVHTYCANIHDPTLASAIQTMCSKLLLNLIDPIASKDPAEATKILQRILLAFVTRMEAMAEIRDEWGKWSRAREPLGVTVEKVKEREKERQEWEQRRKDKGKGKETDEQKMEVEGGEEEKRDEKSEEKDEEKKEEDSEKMEVDGEDEKDKDKAKVEASDDEPPPLLELDDVDIERAKPVRKAVVMVDPGPDPVKDARFLFRNLLFGFKTLSVALSRMGGHGPDAELMCRFFDAAVKCMVVFDSSRDQGREQKEVMEVLSTTLVNTELVIFQEVIENRMGFFFEELIRVSPRVTYSSHLKRTDRVRWEQNHELLVIPQSLLSNEQVSQHFVAILFRFLSDRLPDLGNNNKENTSVMLRLYKMSFMAVTIFPEKNEPVLLPHLTNLIMNSLKLAGQAAEPNSYYLLLRALFRSIGGGRFEILYNEVLPSLQVLLEQLNALLKSADKSRKDLFAELILTVPVRLSVLLPYLSYLMRPLVHALQAGSDLISQGLRTLELCVDNLTQEFLGPLMAPVIDEVMVGLWKLLRPLPFNHQHAHTTMRILGKIGGRNRKGFDPPKLEWKPVGPEALLNVKFEGKDAAIRIGPSVDVALKIIKRGDVHYRRVAYSFLKYSIPIFLREGLPAGEPEETFGNVLRGLYEATRVDEFSDEANKYILDLARLIFGLELDKELPENPAHAKQVLPLCSALIDGIIENLCSVETPDLTKAAEQTLAVVELLISKRDPEAKKLYPPTALLHQMMSRLASLCYDPSWQRKTGAAMGISILTSKVTLPVKFIAEHEIEIVRALVFAIKDMPGEAPSNSQMVVDTLHHVVSICNQASAREELGAQKPALNYLVGLLLLEVCSQVSAVRAAVKKALSIISDAAGVPLTEMLMPVRDRLLGPIFTKPLRALGFTMQIGHIDAITYCITREPPLLEVDEQLVRLLHEALGIADAEDTALLGGKATHKTMAPLTQLRVVCVQLLSAALANPQLNTPTYNQTRVRALSVYFKLLYAKAPEVVDAAYQSLKQVMLAQGKLPKDLLQSGLKPVLMNLADHKKLSVASLQVRDFPLVGRSFLVILTLLSPQGLARLLELLTNYFKVEIGQKLVDHFRSLAVPADVLRASAKQPSEDTELEVMAAIVNIFHLLPHPAAGQYLEDVVKMVVDVERLLKKLKTSIFTVPLAKFLRLHPAETTAFFFDRLSDERFVTTFRAVISSEHGQPIRDHISASAGQLFNPCFNTGGDIGYHAALVIKELILVDRSWIVTNDAVLGRLIQRWVSDVRRQRLAMQGTPHVQQLKEDAVVVEIFIAYLEQAEHIDLLFHVVDSYTYSTSADHTVLSRFLNRHVALSTNVAFKRAILDRFIDIFENAGVTKAHKSAALRLLVNPILLISFSRGEREADLIDVEWIAKVHDKIWHPLLTGAPDLGTLEEEELRVELCHMTTQLIRSVPNLISLSDTKKDVIKFGWVSIRFDDITVTQSAYVLIASFLAQFESPNKIIVQIYVALLRAHQPEARNLVREALDILAPALPKRMAGGGGTGGATGTGGPSEVMWAKWTRKILIEEGSTTPLLVNVYQLIVRHPDLFFGTRDLFFPHMVASLAKLTLSTTITADTRVLTLDVIELILKWEKKRIELAKQEQAKMDVDDGAAAGSGETPTISSPKREKSGKTERAVSVAPSTTSSGPVSSYVPPPSLRDQAINNLLRFISNSTEPLQRNNLVYRALALLRELIGPNVWGESNVKLSFFQRTFANDVNDEALSQLCNSAEVLNVVSSYKPAEWHLSNIAVLHGIVEKGFASGEMRLASALRPVVERLFEHLPRGVTAESGDVSPQAKAFVEWARSTVDEGLRSMNNLPAVMLILQSWSKVEPDRIDAFIPSLIRVFSRYTKEHTASPTVVSSVDPQLRLLVSSLEVLRQRVSHLGEQRRWFLSAIVQLVEKSSNVDVCRFLLQMTRKWVFDKEEQYPTAKEKAGILAKMMSFESRNSEALQKEFLNLILDIYTDPQLARTELTFRLEPAFLMGCKVRDPVLRSKFLAVFDKSLATGLFSRLHYILGVQSWEMLSETYWIHQALDLLLGAVDTQDPLFVVPTTASTAALPADFVKQLEGYNTGNFLGAARKLLYADPNATHATWVSTFKAGWAVLGRTEQRHLAEFMVSLLMKEYHLRSVDRRPNVVQTLLQGALACSPPLLLPPHVVRYHARTFNAWHTGIELLQETLENPRESDSVKETAMDALTELYAELSEDDLLYGLWRRRAAYNETNAALSWEQIGEWGQAQVLHESAQITARSGVLPFTESELALWEDHWIVAAQKLQQWDVLSDMAKNEGNKELLLECAWRLADWNQERPMIEAAIESMSPVATPRRRIFEAYLALLSTYSVKTPEEATAAKKAFNKLCDEGIQLSLRKWYYLPETVTQAHVPLLQVFQQFVELQETQSIFQSLAQTNASNLDARSSELKSILGTWRDRLPNLWDDVNIWSDLVAWRQHVFSAINKAYLPLVPPPNAPGGAQNASSFAYRGFHETAWIINRFAHVARKHHLNEVCITSLTKIYTLPNIEIQEAFLKLREQAKSHYHNPAELASGLEVINNTNLMYFNGPQKAEFFTLKGMFLAKLHLHDEANQTFNLAVSMDMTFAKAWAEWGEYQDRMFKENPTDLNIAANAVSCYLQAAGLYKNAKVRKLLVRILWLLSLDDANGTISKAFDNYKGEVPTWYWITFIPQLLLALSQREARYVRVILLKIAKAYPQALFFQLRTIREDLAMAKRQHQAQEAARAAAAKRAAESVGANGEGAADGDASTIGAPNEASQIATPGGTATIPGPTQRHPWEYVDEILAVLKTAFPLLALSMEMIVDQIATRFKPQSEEDIYRLISALLADSLQQYNARAFQPNDDGLLAQTTIGNIARFAENLQPSQIREQFEKDFLTSKPTLREYVQRLQGWRDRYEGLLNKRAKRSNLESSSHWLVEFQYQKFDEIEVPGQYLQHEDNNNNFVRISHFANKYDVARSHGTYFRRISILGQDGSVHQFAIQIPSVRTSRREERIMQLFRMLNCPLATRKEARKRNIQFTVPIVVPLAPGVRLVENDASITALQDIYEQHCDSIGIRREDPVLAFTERIRTLYRQDPPLSYMVKSMASPSDLWHLRKRMTMSMASFIFMTYILSMGGRTPSRIHISRSTGKVFTSDMLPCASNSLRLLSPSLSLADFAREPLQSAIVPNKPEFINMEPVPFRFTPNFQRFIGPHGTEGLLTSSLMAIARCLTESEYDLEHRLSIFWLSMSKSDSRSNLREYVLNAVDSVVRKAKVMSCKYEREKPPSASVPVNQSILELLLQATNPQNLSRCEPTWLPQL
ncbi:SPOSA6832_01706, partial [Sporobolomyces salmonicolor]